jgi:hypothetical protein
MKVGVPNGQILYKDRLAHQMQPLIAILKIEWEGLVVRLPCARPPPTVAAACGKNHDRKNRQQKDRAVSIRTGPFTPFTRNSVVRSVGIDSSEPRCG